jgi:hypothetical protein
LAAYLDCIADPQLNVQLSLDGLAQFGDSGVESILAA